MIITEPFVGAARAMAALDGLETFPVLTLAHPTAELTASDVLAAGARLADDVAAILCGGRRTNGTASAV